MKALRIVSLLVTLLSCFWLVITLEQWPKAVSNNVQTTKDVVILQKETFYPQTGSPKERSTRQRWIKSNGEWKEVRIQRTPNQPTEQTYITLNSLAGRYVSKGEVLEYDGAFAPPNDKGRSPSFLKSHKEFSREENLFGYTAFILKAEKSPTDWLEQWYVPEVSEIPIKLVISNQVGKTIIDPISIEFKLLNDSDFELPNLPISTKKIEHDIDQAYQLGQVDKAASLRKMLTEFQAKQRVK